MTVAARDLRNMSRQELDELFRASPPGPVPNGRARGSALVFPGTAVDRVIGGLIHLLIWRGKTFRTDGEGTSLKNLISPFSVPLFRAEVYPSESWFAEGQAIILDYSKSSFLVRMIRDEIRRVGEGLYLGQVFWGKRRLILFMLEFPRAVAEGAGADTLPGSE
ncbi:MAG: hypothetical protein U5R14_03490 [Gemmatimonadota bacterium]|nr:hypothetical protein [Gemmatimonadota bacterium]